MSDNNEINGNLNSANTAGTELRPGAPASGKGADNSGGFVPASGERLMHYNAKKSIANKLILYITLLVFGIIAATSVYIAHQQQILLINKMIEKAEYLNNLLLVSFSEAILSNQLTTLQYSVEDVKRNDSDVVLCEVYDLDARCIASSIDANRGVIKSSDGVNKVSHDLIVNSMKTSSTQRNFISDGGHFEVAVPLVISKTVKGSLIVRYSLDKVHKEIMNSYIHSVLICVIAIIIGWIISVFMSRKITTPIFDLARGANEILNGNYDYKISKISDDETGIISTAFNSVTSALTLKIKQLSEYSENLARTNAELDKKISEMKSLQDLGKIISSIFNLEELLRAIIQNATIVMKSRRCSIILVNDKTGDLYIKVAKGMDEAGDFTENIKLKTGGLITDYCIKQKQSLLVTDVETDDRFPEAKDARYKTKSFIAVPLVINDRVIGMISITEKYNSDIYNGSDLQLLQIFANQAVIAIENARLYERLVVREKLERELEIAHNIQMSMMPQKYPDIKGISIAGIAIPAKEVGGDYYDFLPVSEAKVGITIGDVSGKGVPAALMMVMIHSILRAKVMSEHNPKDIVLELNKFMLNELEPRMFITLFYMILDVDNKTLKYTNAGHNYPMVFHADNLEVDSLKDGGLLLGVFEAPLYDEGEYQLNPGDVVVMYTDGIVEAMNDKDEMYGYEQFCEFVHGIKTKKADEIKEDILEEMRRFMGEAPQYDDLTLIVVKVEKEADAETA
jgi:sigma-B regulation protein RsbU (phosphoserine phosphatase)